jgi:hypothetical protein
VGQPAALPIGSLAVAQRAQTEALFRIIHIDPLRPVESHPPVPYLRAWQLDTVVIRVTDRLGGGEPLRTAYAVAEPNQHRAVALFKLRPDHTADEQVEVVVELTQSALDSLGLKPGMIKPL